MDPERRRHPWSQTDRAELKSAIRATMPRFPAVAAVYLFGSALNDSAEVGDVDLGILQTPGTPTLGAGDLGLIEAAIVAAFRGPLPPLDFRRLTPSQAVFAHEVLRTGGLIYEANVRARALAELEVVREFLDTAWLRDGYRAARLRTVGDAA